MLSRSTHIKNVKVTNCGLSANVQIGDTNYIDGSFEAISVQHDYKALYGDPELFEKYPFFSEPLAIPIIYENITFTKLDKKPTIHVDHLQVTGVASSAVLAVGNISHTRMSSKLFNIRRLADQEDKNPYSNPKGG
ncbi:spore germination protein GerPE [Bacillus massiliigorillae]|uniref:spore germination protein GerPE n=1 Tax=Bacillus massiliigorillae TaxID=1243664 RepID=UPI0005A9D73A|nr:spore germination protein GerPE [Bacillus massiliigorillae]